jgi:hypothetical protein
VIGGGRRNRGVACDSLRPCTRAQRSSG